MERYGYNPNSMTAKRFHGMKMIIGLGSSMDSAGYAKDASSARCEDE